MNDYLIINFRRIVDFLESNGIDARAIKTAQDALELLFAFYRHGSKVPTERVERCLEYLLRTDRFRSRCKFLNTVATYSYDREKKIARLERQARCNIEDVEFLSGADFLRSMHWAKLRYEALKENNGRCNLCGRSQHDGIVLHVDHIKPRQKFPQLALSLSNLQVLCDQCNFGKLALDDTDWRKS